MAVATVGAACARAAGWAACLGVHQPMQAGAPKRDGWGRGVPPGGRRFLCRRLADMPPVLPLALWAGREAMAALWRRTPPPPAQQPTAVGPARAAVGGGGGGGLSSGGGSGGGLSGVGLSGRSLG